MLVARSGTSYDPTLTINQADQSHFWVQDAIYWKMPIHSDRKLRRFIPHSVLDEEALDRRWHDEAFDPTLPYAQDVARVARAGGNVVVAGRRSPHSLYHERLATFEADTVYNQRDAEGFIKLNALRLRTLGQRKKKLKL